MGIGGIGISAFAHLLHAQGHRVSGCDEAVTDTTERLRNIGIQVVQGHSASHITEHSFGRVDVLVASEAVPKNHPELQAAREAGVQVLPRMALLGTLLSVKNSIGVIGTHGKTTTSSMIGVSLLGAGLDPSAYIGGVVPEFGGTNARTGAGPFVAEVDESDKHFAGLQCETAVFTNAEDDHVGGNQATYWESVEEQHAAFAQFVSQAQRVLACSDWRDRDGNSLEPLLAGAKETIRYGTTPEADYRAVNLRPDEEGTAFTVLWRGAPLIDARVSLPGVHNVLNALAALAVTHLYGGDMAGAVKALANFSGPGRRWQKIGLCGGALVVDDYAHNPTKVAAALEAARQTGRRVRVIFQPHRYLRTQQSWEKLSEALMNADEVFLLDIAAAGETPIEGIHTRLIEHRMRGLGHGAVHYFPDREVLTSHLKDTVTDGDLLLTVGAGDVWKIARRLVEESGEAKQ